MFITNGQLPCLCIKTDTEKTIILLCYVSMQYLYFLHKSCAPKHCAHPDHDFIVHQCAASVCASSTLDPAPLYPVAADPDDMSIPEKPTTATRPWKLRTKPIISPTRPNPNPSPGKPFLPLTLFFLFNTAPQISTF